MSVAVGGIGYLLLLLELFGIGPILRFLYPPTLSIMMVWYGLYFGILGRDCAEVAADRMVRSSLVTAPQLQPPPPPPRPPGGPHTNTYMHSPTHIHTQGLFRKSLRYGIGKFHC